MFDSIKHVGALSAAMLLCAPVAAQTTARPDPLNANAAVPAVTYQSPFATYRRASDDAKPLGWREANDATARIGGWRVYAREAQSPEPTAAAPQAPAAAAATSARNTPNASSNAPAAAAGPSLPAAPATPSNAHQHHKP
ncbi:MAG: hypothetical protein H7143_09820 [Pseudorhodobacter sp.]|nr:hypothetical protein [Rhizobacter sp.]